MKNEKLVSFTEYTEANDIEHVLISYFDRFQIKYNVSMPESRLVKYLNYINKTKEDFDYFDMKKLIDVINYKPQHDIYLSLNN